MAHDYNSLIGACGLHKYVLTHSPGNILVVTVGYLNLVAVRYHVNKSVRRKLDELSCARVAFRRRVALSARYILVYVKRTYYSFIRENSCLGMLETNTKALLNWTNCHLQVMHFDDSSLYQLGRSLCYSIASRNPYSGKHLVVALWTLKQVLCTFLFHNKTQINKRK